MGKGWTVDTLRNHFAQRLRDQDRTMDAKFGALEAALELQAAEYERRLTALNHAHERAEETAHTYLTQEKYEDAQKSERLAAGLAKQRQDDRLDVLESWKAKATGVGAMLVLLSGAIGAAIVRALGG